ncbi:MAG: hypothetical protein ACM3PF_03990 [Bacteroidota bacterium]
MNTKQTKTQSTFRLRAATGAALAAPLLLALVALGCGEQKEKASATVASTETAPAQAQPGAVPATKTGAALTAETGTTSAMATGEAKEDAGLPPEVVAVPPEGISAPGTVVTIAAVGSTDVTSVMLTDRVGAKTPFTFDSAANMWKVSYRVPLDVKTDRLALSVTAGTETNRWKRVWVFLQLREEAKEAATAPDSTK